MKVKKIGYVILILAIIMTIGLFVNKEVSAEAQTFDVSWEDFHNPENRYYCIYRAGSIMSNTNRYTEINRNLIADQDSCR